MITVIAFLALVTMAVAITRDVQAHHARTHHQPTHPDGMGWETPTQ